MKMKMIVMPGIRQDIDLPEGSTLNDLLNKAEIDRERFDDFRVNLEQAKIDRKLADKDEVIVVAKMHPHHGTM